MPALFLRALENVQFFLEQLTATTVSLRHADMNFDEFWVFR